jgi:pimeloyl-ACP methyl ester carboxylesterase
VSPDNQRFKQRLPGVGAMEEIQLSTTTRLKSGEAAGHQPTRRASADPGNFAISSDGTKIAYSRQGVGSPLILVDGALCHRAMGPSASLAKALMPNFTVFTYDRRGRNESGDTGPYAPEREVDDIQALLNVAGGEAFLWGMSSGALLSVAAATHLRGIRKLVAYEAPLIVDDTRRTTGADWERVRRAVETGKRGDAVKAFLASVGMPRPAIFAMQFTPMWKTLKAVAHTLPNDGAIVEQSQVGRPLGDGPWRSVAVPTLVTDGGASPEWMRNGNRALAAAIPNARYQTLPNQSHMLNSKAYAPILVDFFNE